MEAVRAGIRRRDKSNRSSGATYCEERGLRAQRRSQTFKSITVPKEVLQVAEEELETELNDELEYGE